MTFLPGETAVRAWLDEHGFEHVIVVSPHLDDAVFSVAGFLSGAPERSEVITLFTEALPGQSSNWARAAGFGDSAAEHAARRQEDILAMRSIGCRFQHLGLRPGDLSEARATQLVQTLQRAHPAGLDNTLVLLPAGAGSPSPRSAMLMGLVLRILRRPGSAFLPHGEHVQTRDRLWHALAGSTARIGFYAELPYAWSQTNHQLQQHLLSDLGCRTDLIELRPDTVEKNRLADLYRSQLALVLGRRSAYRRRVLSRNECLCIVAM